MLIHGAAYSLSFFYTSWILLAHTRTHGRPRACRGAARLHPCHSNASLGAPEIQIGEKKGLRARDCALCSALRRGRWGAWPLAFDCAILRIGPGAQTAMPMLRRGLRLPARLCTAHTPQTGRRGGRGGGRAHTAAARDDIALHEKRPSLAHGRRPQLSHTKYTHFFGTREAQSCVERVVCHTGRSWRRRQGAPCHSP